MSVTKGALSQFSFEELCFLYCIPVGGGDCDKCVSTYMFVNRDSEPTPEFVERIFERAHACGIVRKDGEIWIVNDEWYSFIHAADAVVANEIDAMIAFAEQAGV